MDQDNIVLVMGLPGISDDASAIWEKVDGLTVFLLIWVSAACLFWHAGKIAHLKMAVFQNRKSG